MYPKLSSPLVLNTRETLLLYISLFVFDFTSFSIQCHWNPYLCAFFNHQQSSKFNVIASISKIKFERSPLRACTEWFLFTEIHVFDAYNCWNIKHNTLMYNCIKFQIKPITRIVAIITILLLSPSPSMYVSWCRHLISHSFFVPDLIVFGSNITYGPLYLYLWSKATPLISFVYMNYFSINCHLGPLEAYMLIRNELVVVDAYFFDDSIVNSCE